MLPDNQTYSEFDSLSKIQYNFFMKSQYKDRFIGITVMLVGLTAAYFKIDGAWIAISVGGILTLIA